MVKQVRAVAMPPKLVKTKTVFWAISIVVGIILLVMAIKYCKLTMDCHKLFMVDRESEEQEAPGCTDQNTYCACGERPVDKETCDAMIERTAAKFCWSIHALNVIAVFVSGLQVVIGLGMIFVTEPTPFYTITLNMGFITLMATCIIILMYNSSADLPKLYTLKEPQSTAIPFLGCLFGDIGFCCVMIFIGVIDHCRQKKKPTDELAAKTAIGVIERTKEGKEQAKLEAADTKAKKKKKKKNKKSEFNVDILDDDSEG